MSALSANNSNKRQNLWKIKTSEPLFIVSEENNIAYIIKYKCISSDHLILSKRYDAGLL